MNITLINEEKNVYFHTYKELSDYCYPFEKNLARGISDEQKFIILQSIATFYRQRVDEINSVLGYPNVMLVNISNNYHYLGRCWGIEKSIIELDAGLICAHPLVLTEVIIHELSHFEVPNHKKAFYDCMQKNIEKMGLQQQLYGYELSLKGHSPKVIQDLSPSHEQFKIIRKLFRIPLKKKSLYPPIIHGTLPEFFSFQDLANFCIPTYKILPRVTGLLDRIKIISYAEKFYKEVIREIVHYFDIEIDNVFITKEEWILDSHSLGIPLFVISLNEQIFKQLIVRAFTTLSLDKDFISSFKDNLHNLGLEETHATSIFLFDFFRGWNNCFDENGMKRLNFLFSEVIDVPKPKQLSFTFK